MDILSILALLGGVALFLFGMHVMSGGLERISGDRLEGKLKKLTSNKFASISLGAGITVAMQSSSALTVMLVGLVNSGIMILDQTVGVIMGSNIGTTLTGWILSLSGIQGDNLALQLCKPANFSPILALIGVILLMVSRSEKKKNIGTILVGFAVLMFSMTMMSNAVEPLADSPQFVSLLTAFSIPIVGLLIGTGFTAIIQSSAAAIGIIQAMSLTGTMTYNMAIPLMLGANIGTCATAIIASFGVKKEAKRVAILHLMIKIIGAAIFMVGYYGLDAVFHFPMTQMIIDPFGVAIINTIYNIANTAILLPFEKQLIKMVRRMLPDKAEDIEEKGLTGLDDILLRTPAVAVSESMNATVKMAQKARETVGLATALIYHYSQKDQDVLVKVESKIDRYEDQINSYLVKVSSLDMTHQDGQTVTKLFHTVGDFERISDNAAAIGNTLQRMHDKKASFTDETKKELGVICSALNDITDMTLEVFRNDDDELARKIEPLEQVIDDLSARIKKRHVIRIKEGTCTVDNGISLTDILTNIRRVSDYCSNIAVCVIQIHKSTFETHSYLQKVKYTNQAEFMTNFEEFKGKYIL